MLDETRITEIAAELDVARRDRAQVPLLTARNPGMTVEDAYAIQGLWADGRLAAGRRLVGRKIGLTSKVMQVATGITEPDYGVIFDDMVYQSGDTIPFDAFTTLRVEVELAFVLAQPLAGAGRHGRRRARGDRLRRARARDPELAHRARGAHDRRHDLGQRRDGRHGARRHAHRPGGRRPAAGSSAILRRNGDIEESGVAAAVLDHPATGVAWLAGKLAQHGASLAAGETILAGSFTRPIWIERGDDLLADYKELGTIACRFA